MGNEEAVGCEDKNSVGEILVKSVNGGDTLFEI